MAAVSAALRAAAVAHEPATTAEMDRVGAAVGATPAGRQYRLKEAESMATKLTDEAVARGTTVAEAGARLKDALRYTMILPVGGYTEGVERAVSALNADGHEVLRLRNTWDGSIYRGVNAIVATPDGYRYEVQFHTQGSFEVKTLPEHHHDYEVWDHPGTSADQRAAAEARMTARYASVVTPPGVEAIASFDHLGG